MVLAETQKFQEVENYIQSNLADQFSLRELAEMCFTSYDNFQHQFSNHYCQSPWAFVKNTRLEHAAGFLRHSDYSINLIADMVGYTTSSSFCKAFSQRFNHSPREFRQLHQLPVDNHIIDEGYEYLLAYKSLEYETVMELGRFELLPTMFFNFKRTEHEDAATFDVIINEFLTNERLARRGLVITSPQVYCMRYNNWTRLDCGYISADPYKDVGFDLQRKFKRGKYFVTSFTADLKILIFFIYKLINMSTRSGDLKLRAHHTFVRVNFIPDLSLEIWIPVI